MGNNCWEVGSGFVTNEDNFSTVENETGYFLNKLFNYI